MMNTPSFVQVSQQRGTEEGKTVKKTSIMTSRSHAAMERSNTNLSSRLHKAVMPWCVPKVDSHTTEGKLFFPDSETR
jgi:hypothetical protein